MASLVRLKKKNGPDRVTLAMNFLVLEAQTFNHTANAGLEILNDCHIGTL